MRALFALAAIVATLIACGGDATGTSYPDVIGTYDVAVTFDGVSLVGAGTLTITGSKDGVLTGDADLTITGGSQPVRQTGLRGALMRQDGFVQFGITPTGMVTQWSFGGQRASNGSFAGTHAILIKDCAGCASAPRSGSWTATRR